MAECAILHYQLASFISFTLHNPSIVSCKTTSYAFKSLGGHVHLNEHEVVDHEGGLSRLVLCVQVARQIGDYSENQRVV